MPPVFGPWSPSKMRLWSWLEASREHVLAIDHDDEAGFLAVEEVLDHDAGAGIAQLVARQHVVDGRVRLLPGVMATTTPLPAARPSALMTIGAPCLSHIGVGRLPHRRRSRTRRWGCCGGPGSPWRRPWRIRAGRLPLVGPKIVRPRARKASTTPAASGASGPTTVRWILFCSAKSASASGCGDGCTFSSSCSRAVPALPGAT